MKHLMTVLLASACLLATALANPGEDLLVSKLPGSYKKAAKVPEAPLVAATNLAVKANRGLAPQVTAAAVRRAENCTAVEAVVRTALRGLVPTPTSLEVYAITRAAIANAAPSDNNTSSPSCTEGILTTAAAEYPQYASVLNDSGKQVVGKQFAGKVPPGEETGIGAAPGIAPLAFPAVVVLPNPAGGIVRHVTPDF